jgi:hypothetical protein
MKKVRFALIAVIVACTMISTVKADGIKSSPRKSVSMTFDRAIKDPGLVATIYDKVDPSFLNRIEQLYIVEVVYKNVVYKILGSRQDWLRLFRPQPIPLRSGKLQGNREKE